jgi:TPR repeat protein
MFKKLFSFIRKSVKTSGFKVTPEDLYLLGYKYYNGESFKENHSKAFKMWKQAAERGHAAAQGCLANLYSNGDGISQNHKKAFKWYKKSAEQGFAKSQYNLGQFYLARKEYTEAFKWYKKSAEQGVVEAQNNLASMYYNGDGVEQHYTDAFK